MYSVVTQDDLLWKKHCRLVWDCEELCAESWYECWLKFCKEFDRYKPCFAQIKSALKKMEIFVRRCGMHHKFMHKTTEKELNDLEKRLGVQLPLDYRCYLRLCGKQSIPLGAISYPISSYQLYRRRYALGQEMEENEKMLSLLSVKEARIETVRGWGKSVDFLAIAETVSSIPSQSDKVAKECLLMITSEQAAKFAGQHPLSHVLEAFSSRISYGLIRGEVRGIVRGGCVVSPGFSPSFLWLQTSPVTCYADWLSAEATKMQSYYFSKQQNMLTRYTLQPNYTTSALHFTARIATAALFDEEAASERHSSALVCLIVELSGKALGEYKLVENSLLFDGKRLQNVSFAPSTSQTKLCPGQIVEYRSEPLERPRDEEAHDYYSTVGKTLEGYIVMQNVNNKFEASFQIDLPKVSLETFEAKPFKFSNI